MRGTHLGLLAAALAGLAGLAGSLAATPLALHPGEQLTQLALFSSGDRVVATWWQGIAVIDPGTLALADVEPPATRINPVLATGDSFFFNIYPQPGGVGLYSLRGGEVVLLNHQVPFYAARLGDRLVYAPGGEGQRIVISDGTPEGTGQLADAAPGWLYPCIITCDAGEIAYPRRFHGTAGGRLFFLVMDPREVGDGGQTFSFWSLDAPATAPGSPPVPASSARSLAHFAEPLSESLLTTDGSLVWIVRGSSGSQQLWRSDGTPGGTRHFLFELPESPLRRISDLTELGGQLYFLVETADNRTLWRSDGESAAQTAAIHAFGAGPRIAGLWKAGGRLFLPVDAGGLGEELWTSDGSAAGTRLLRDVRPGPSGAQPREFLELSDGRFVVSLDDGVHGHEPWISDGSAEGTRLLADEWPGSPGSSPSHFIAAAGRLFFAGTTGAGRRPSYLELPPAPPQPPTCPADQLCLQDGRFRVEIEWIAGGSSGPGQRALASDEAGVFTFFSPDNWEVMVKVLDGCGLNQNFWVFAAAATDLQYEIRVTDTYTSQIRTYPHPGGAPAPATTDIAAFATCGATPP